MKFKFAMIGLMGFATFTGEAFAQNAAVSSYMDPKSSGNVDVRIRDVRIPSTGQYIGTYWCTLGYWTTGTTSGYGGMQWTSDNTAGPKNVIYSQWNDFTTSAYNLPTTRVTLFGGEGTGVKSINNDSKNQWKPDYWHTMADRVWNKGTDSYFAVIMRNGETNVWRHMITWKTPEANLKFSGAGYTFLEDWTGDGNYRESQLRKSWNRNPSTKTWTPVTQWAYNINDADTAVGKRSYNKRTNWRAGKASDATGEYVFYGAGGTVASTNNNNATFTIAHTETSPQQEYGTAVVSKLVANVIAGNKLELSWINDSTTVPQWSYKISIKNGATTLLTASDTIPECRKDTIALGSLTPNSVSYTATLEVTDFFDGKAPVKSVTFGNGATNLTLLSPLGGSFLTGDSLKVEFAGLSSGTVDAKLMKSGVLALNLGTVNASNNRVAALLPKSLSDGSDYRIIISQTSGSAKDSSGLITISHPDMSKVRVATNKLSVVGFDSEQNSTDQAAKNVVDGDSSTFWHTNWSSSVVPPHYITLKLASPTKVSGLYYLPRQDGGSNGNIGQYEIYVSTDGQNWGSAVKTGTFVNGVAQSVYFTPKLGQYVKLIEISEAAGQAFASAAEIGVYEDLTQIVNGTASTSFKNPILWQQTSDLIQAWGEGIVHVKLYNLNGAILAQAHLNNGLWQMNTSLLPGGVYTLQIQGINGMKSQKVVIQP